MRIIRRAIIVSTVVAALSWQPAVAEKPKDYSDVDGATIKTIKIERVAGRRRVIVAVGNQTANSFNSTYDCTLFDKNGAPIGASAGVAQGVPPGQIVVSKSISFKEPADAAACRFRHVLPR